ncbi:hypothetical protein Q6A51_13290 [Pseudomonas sp. KFB-139]|uniref:Uncharacterized protein n=1 Tax=Pseudomonas serbiensis TaxID=3064350 RepID=A0ABT9CQJ9_9PSED|nr:hypothetical protein [Pseudomonas sp. KFB-138]MDO7927764.1 hypothetical protein [Pseudomonas sp. KFB-138]
MLSLITKLFQKITDKKTKPTEIEKFMSDHAMTFHGYGGLNINRLVVHEFGYLIRYLTDKKLDSFRDFRAISKSALAINQEINAELSKEILRESEALGVSRETAVGNMQRLQGIINTIAQYTALCDRLNVDLYAARDLQGKA